MPTFDPDTLPALTRARLPQLAGAKITVAPLAQDGSDRSYYRLTVSLPETGSFEPIIVMRYGTDRAENLCFTPITLFLKTLGVACPEIFSYDEERHLIWLQDLGGGDLWSIRDEPWETVRRPLYESALREVAKIHNVTEEGLKNVPEAPVEALQAPFDAGLYRWEQDYFFENFVSRFSDLDSGAVARMRRHAGLSSLADELASLPRTLVHRDFQSRNILVRDGQAWLIDYQGMRFGRPEYDIASLLCDPYVLLRAEERDTLLALCYRFAPPPVPSPGEFRDRFLKCAAQRLMQALGAYGFLGIVKQKRHFLDSIPRAVQNLRGIVRELPLLEPLEPALILKDSIKIP